MNNVCAHEHDMAWYRVGIHVSCDLWKYLLPNLWTMSIQTHDVSFTQNVLFSALKNNHKWELTRCGPSLEAVWSIVLCIVEILSMHSHTRDHHNPKQGKRRNKSAFLFIFLFLLAKNTKKLKTGFLCHKSLISTLSFIHKIVNNILWRKIIYLARCHKTCNNLEHICLSRDNIRCSSL